MRKFVFCFLFALGMALPLRANDTHAVYEQSAPAVVKIYGAGGKAGLENYQSGIFVSGAGEIITVNSPVLDTDELVVVDSTGRRLPARVKRADLVLGVALVQAELGGNEAEFFKLTATTPPEVGQEVVAISNPFGVAAGAEQLSVQRGVLGGAAPLALASPLDPEINEERTVWLLDINTSNPGSAGGAVVDREGQLIGLIGPERRSAVTGAWLNYALPTELIAIAVEQLRSSPPRVNPLRPAALRPQRPTSAWGFWLVPEVSPRTAPYVDEVAPNSPAAAAGMLPDDLIVLVGGHSTSTIHETTAALNAASDSSPEFELVIQRAERLFRIKLNTP